MGEVTSKICLYHSGTEAKIEALCKKMDLRLDSIGQSISLAKDEMDRRLESMNEFRSQLSAQAATFIPRKEVQLMLDKMEAHFDLLAQYNKDKIDLLDRSYSERKGSKQWSDHIITALIAMAIFVIAHFVMKF